MIVVKENELNYNTDFISKYDIGDKVYLVNTIQVT